ncbi:hypothetical protein PTKIN_Ptkin04bG0053200 [Pterospermum kingtungense]
MELTMSWLGRTQYKRHHMLQVLVKQKEVRKKNKLHDTSETLSASDHDAPELVVLIQESDYQSVKDIFIDRVLPSQSALNYKDISSKFQNYVTKQRALENLVKKGEDDLDGRDDNLPDKSSKKTIPGMQCFKEIQVGDSISLKPMERSAIELFDENSHLSEVSSNSEAESGSTIHFSESSSTTMSSLEESLEGPECQQPQKTEIASLSRTEYRMSRSLTGPSQSFVSGLDYGDCDPFAVFPLSGPVPCSGAISLRSASSSASSHSFAFPILPSEWNGTPVRMVEADQRQPTKHQSWRTCFLCCKF